MAEEKKSEMKSLADILAKFNPKEDKYISSEYQLYGVFLAEKLGDTRRKGLYIKYAKLLPRPILEKAYQFVIDSKARNMGALFMWKLKEMGVFEKFKLRSEKKPTKKIDDDSKPKVVKPRKKRAQAHEDELF